MLLKLFQLFVVSPLLFGAVTMVAINSKRLVGLTASVLIMGILWHWFSPIDGSPIGDLIKNTGHAPTVSNSVFGMIVIAAYFAMIVVAIRLNRAVTPPPPAQKTATEDNPLVMMDYEIPKLTFADVRGMAEIKNDLLLSAKAIIGNGKNGVLLFGPPGNGKTFFAEAFAGEFSTLLPEGKKAAFMSVSIADLASRWVNQTTEQIRSMFESALEAAKKEGACVLFIDEIDSVLVRRENIVQADSEISRSVNAMLTLVVEHRDFKKSGIVIVGATNFLDRLDSAAIRDGRFDFKVEIKAPDYEARLGLLLTTCKAVSLNQDAAKRAARRWEGFNVARMMSVGETVGNMVAKAGRSEATFDDLMLALRKTQGTKGGALPESTASLIQLEFNESLGNRLKQLANRMNRIADIEDMGGTVPKGVLFFGPPGTGKTAVAKALAISSGWAYLSTTGQKLMGDKKEIERLTSLASDIRPCIIFVDEADDILMNRVNNPYGRSDTNNLLALMDGDLALSDVMFIAATNHPDDLDSAALRGGRFSEHFEFELPEDDSLLVIIKAFMGGKTMVPWSPEFTPEAALEVLSGLSPANAKDQIQQAINSAVSRLDGSLVTISDLRNVNSTT